CRLQLLHNVLESFRQRPLTRDHHIIVAGPRMSRGDKPDRLLEPTPRPVALDSRAKPLRRGKSEARRTAGVLSVGARLKHEARRGPRAPAAGSQEVGAITQPFERYAFALRPVPRGHAS